MSKPLLLRRDAVLTQDSDNLINSGNIYNTTNELKTSLDTLTSKVTDSISILENQLIVEENWVDDTTYEDFPFRAEIIALGCTPQTGGQIIFAVSDATAGIFAPVGQTQDNVIYIYANEKVTVTIPTILLFKE